METACGDIKDNDGGKITNTTKYCLLTQGRYQRGTFDLTAEIRTFDFYILVVFLLVFAGSLVLLRKWESGMASSQSPGQQILLKSIAVGLRLWACIVPRSKSLLWPLTSAKQSQPHTETAMGLHLYWGQVEDVTSFLPGLILGLSNVGANIIYTGVVCLSITEQRPQGSHWQIWVLLGFWLTPDSRVYFYRSSGKIGCRKQRVGLTHFSKVKSVSEQILSKLQIERPWADLGVLKCFPGWIM